MQNEQIYPSIFLGLSFLLFAAKIYQEDFFHKHKSRAEQRRRMCVRKLDNIGAITWWYSSPSFFATYRDSSKFKKLCRGKLLSLILFWSFKNLNSHIIHHEYVQEITHHCNYTLPFSHCYIRFAETRERVVLIHWLHFCYLFELDLILWWWVRYFSASYWSLNFRAFFCAFLSFLRKQKI